MNGEAEITQEMIAEMKVIQQELRRLRQELSSLKDDKSRRLLNTDQACEYLGLKSRAHFSNNIGKHLRRISKGRQFMYPVEELDRYRLRHR